MGVQNYMVGAIGLTLWNPTSEDFDVQYAGYSFTIKSGEKQSFEINCAKHLLNGFGQRGLTSLDYGADESQIAKDAIARNIEFKKRMITDFNQKNENRKMSGLGYLPPSKEIRKYAEELMFDLFEPYTLRNEERAKTSEVERKNQDLQAQVDKLTELVTKLLEKNEPKQEQTEEPKKPGNPNWQKKG